MALPVIQIDESNGSGQTVTPNIQLIAYASLDQPSASGLSAANPVLISTNSFEKWLRARVQTPAQNSLSNFTVSWSATAPTDSTGSATNLAFKFGVNAAYATPTANVSTVATTVCVGAPATAVNAPANTAGAYGGYIVNQMQVGAGAAGGDAIFPAGWFNLNYIYS